MPFLKTPCPVCDKTAEGQREFVIGEKIVTLLKCGHLMQASQMKAALSPENLVSLDGKHLYPFQIEGVRFLEQSGGRAAVLDEMGLGKTVQGLGTIILHEKEMTPFLAIVKSALKTQWQRETMRWGGEEWFAQVIDSPKDHPLKGFKGYIMSYDILRRYVVPAKRSTLIGGDGSIVGLDHQIVETDASKNKGKLQQLVERLGIKTVILDEVQQIKNTESQRTIFTRALCKHVPNVIALSGTPIKNNAAEYFPILNILKPEMFPNYSRFVYAECDSYFNGYGYKTAGLRYPKKFMEKTKNFLIRRERKDVLPDLPPVRRTFQFHELAKEVEQAYIDEFKRFRDDYNKIKSGSNSSVRNAAFEESGSVIAYLSKMRHLTGLSKINPCIDYIMEVMGSTEDRITIFLHHQDVMDIMEERLNDLFKELNLPKVACHRAGAAALDTEAKFEKARVLLASTLAGGEGLNLQKLCRRFVMLERQWNPANEKQAEDRFPRPEGIKTDFIDGVYMTAVGTVDEFFAEIVERKREIVEKTLSGKAVPWDQSSLMKELAEVLAMNGGKKWSV